MVLKVKVKLTRAEVFSIQQIMRQAASLQLRSDMRNETIILAENWETWIKKYVSADERKVKSYQIALSLARILHDRLQKIPVTDANQSLLTKLDQELTNLNMKPLLQLTLS